MNKAGILRKTFYLLAAGAVLLLDQASKEWVAQYQRVSAVPYEVIQGFLNFDYAENTGISFSMLQNGGDTGRYVLAALAFIAALAVLWFFWQIRRTDNSILGGCAMLLAGIVGNLTDRLRHGFVVDFIDVQFWGWHYPTFNVADSAIWVGAGLLILDMFLHKREIKTNKVVKPDSSLSTLS